LPAGLGRKRGLGLHGILLASRKPGDRRQRQDRHLARQMCGSRRAPDVPVECQLHRVRVYDQHGAGATGKWWGTTEPSGTAF